MRPHVPVPHVPVPHVPVPHVPVPPVPSRPSFPGGSPADTAAAAAAARAGRRPRRRRRTAATVVGACAAIALVTGATTAAAAPAAPPVPATQPPVVPTAPPTSWASSQVVSTDQLPISIPGVTRASGAPAAATTTPRGVTTTAVLRLTASTPREAPPPTDPVWLKIRQCESGNRYTLNTGNGYYGAYQFAAGTWRKLGLAGLPHEAPPALQDEAARLLYLKAGWGVWGGCARRLGLT